MRNDLLELVARRTVVTRHEAVAATSTHVVDDAVAAGVIRVVFRGFYCLRGHEQMPEIRRVAAGLAVPGSVVSHVDALAAVRIVTEEEAASDYVHVTVAAGTRHPRNRVGLRVHRLRELMPCDVLQLTSGLRIMHPVKAAVASWPLLPEAARRRALIDGSRRGRLSIPMLQHEASRFRGAGASDLRSLVAHLAEGCQSELEIWGVQSVFDHPSLPRSVPQHPVRLRGRTVYLDRAYVDVKLAVELDGAAYHFGRAQRELDMARDAELATLGWLVLRFSYRRLHDNPAGVRREITEVLAARRRQLAG